MPITPVGPLSVPLDKLADLFASSPAFRSWTSLSTVESAKERVYVTARSASGSGAYIRPFVLLALVSACSIRRGGYPEGFIDILFEADVSSLTKSLPTEAYYEFANNVGLILQDVIKASEEDGALSLDPMGFDLSMIQRSDIKEREDYFEAWFKIAFGVRSV